MIDHSSISAALENQNLLKRNQLSNKYFGGDECLSSATSFAASYA